MPPGMVDNRATWSTAVVELGGSQIGLTTEGDHDSWSMMYHRLNGGLGFGGVVTWRLKR